MNKIIYFLFMRLLYLGIIFFPMVNIAEASCSKKMSDTELKEILSTHRDWLSEGNSSLKKIDLNCIDHNSKSLREANLRWANLAGIDLGFMDLSGADLRNTNLTNAILDGASLLDTKLEYADLTGASLVGAQLNRANLNNAYMNNTNLNLATLIETQLSGTDLSGAKIRRVNLKKALYEPIGIPNKDTLGQIKGLETVTFEEGQQASLVELRAVLKNNGLRNLERQVTYAIEKGKTEYASTPVKMFRTIFFKWTCAYGLHPLYGIYWIIFVIFICTFFYYFVIYYSQPRSKVAGKEINSMPNIGYIVKNWEKENSKKNFNDSKPKIITRNKWYRMLCTAIKFSFYSAIEIGWGEITIGHWVKRMQGSEYTLHSYNWVRTVSGTQALISTYLLAITVLSNYGRPFG